jgi:hypothetical protein
MDSTAENANWNLGQDGDVPARWWLSRPSAKRWIWAWSTTSARRGSGVLLIGLGLLSPGGCRTDQAAQDHINQMRAEQIAIEDRYAALRNEYEKLRNRLAAQGDPDAKSSPHPSALPLTYPPGSAPIDELSDELSLDAAWGQPDFGREATGDPSSPVLVVPDLRAPHSVLDPAANGSGPAMWSVPAELLVRRDTSPPPDPADQTFTVRLIVTPVGQDGRAARPDGTYTLRLSDPTKVGDAAQLGYWHFPAEVVRTYLRNFRSPEGFAGVPVQVSLPGMQRPPSQMLAELEFHSVRGQRLDTRLILDQLPAGGGQGTPSAAAILPVPTGVQGLMTSRQPTGTSPGDWRPER